MKNRAVRIIVIICLIPVMLYGCMYLYMLQFLKFKVKTNLAPETKESYAEFALLPEFSDYIERYGVRGFMDPDYQIETYKFDSIDELTAAMPYLNCYADAETQNGKDLKGKKATVYELDYIYPFNGKTSVMPLDFSLLDSKSYGDYWAWRYSIYEYADGSCRFVVNIYTD